MAATDPNPNVDPTITGQEAWFNKDVRVYEDLYVYGNLYYNFDGTDSLDLDNLTVSGIATFNNVDITGSLDLQDLTLRNLFSTGIATFTNAILPEIDNLQVGILTVTEFFRIDNGTTEFVTIPATGSRAGNVGINSTLPDQKLDIGGSIHIDEQIFDSDENPGQPGYFLSRDVGGIRWVSAPPNATADGIFAQNEGINIGVPVTGIAASTSSGSVTIDDTFLIGEGWGRDTYGNLAWGVNYSAKNNTGLSLTSSIGSESSFTDVTVSVTGQALGMTFGVYSVTANADLSITVAEHTMTSSLGSTSLTQTTNETLTGQSLTTSIGNAPAGLFLDVPVTGSSLTTSQGTTSLTQTTTEPVTGQSLTTSIGTITQVPQVIVGVSGLSLTSAMGEEGTQANARVVPTGQSLTSSINSVNVTPWQEVDLGVNNTWQDAA